MAKSILLFVVALVAAGLIAIAIQGPRLRGSSPPSGVAPEHDKAKENIASLRAANLQSQAAEDELRERLEQAMLDQNEGLKGDYTEQYKGAIVRTDQLALALFTEEVIAEAPWTDCLNGEQSERWNGSEVKGFSHDIRDGRLFIVGPDPDAGRQAVLSIGDREQWRDLELEMEFVVERGGADLFLRLGRVPNANTVSCSLVSEGESQNLAAGQTYHLTIRLVGSQFSVRFGDQDIGAPAPRSDPLSWTKSRKGALGFLVPAGLRMQVSSFKVRALR